MLHQLLYIMQLIHMWLFYLEYPTKCFIYGVFPDNVLTWYLEGSLHLTSVIMGLKVRT